MAPLLSMLVASANAVRAAVRWAAIRVRAKSALARVGVGRGEVVDEELIGLGAAEGVDRAADGGESVGEVLCGLGVGLWLAGRPERPWP
ncbi:hypothetical protein ACFVTY_23675 [Streptomyces sp. NPDC058067]|uniref:hypothetical protein n=1 Tax=Streptomyces sp. NPDC058067 TaxID=3346324 RepID=UPI0036E1619D